MTKRIDVIGRGDIDFTTTAARMSLAGQVGRSDAEAPQADHPAHP